MSLRKQLQVERRRNEGRKQEIEREQIIEDFIGEMQGKALSELLEENEAYKELCKQSLQLSEQIKGYLDQQEKDVGEMFEKYYQVRTEREWLNNNCLYRQEMKDEVRLIELRGLL